MLDEQVIALADDGLAPDEIAESLGVDKASVVYALQKRRPAQSAKLVTDADLTEMIGIVKNIARNSDNEFVQLSAAKFVINEGKGRHDAKAGTQVNVHIGDINQQIIEAQKRARLLLLAERAA